MVRYFSCRAVFFAVDFWKQQSGITVIYLKIVPCQRIDQWQRHIRISRGFLVIAALVLERDRRTGRSYRVGRLFGITVIHDARMKKKTIDNET